MWCAIKIKRRHKHWQTHARTHTHKHCVWGGRQRWRWDFFLCNRRRRRWWAARTSNSRRIMDGPINGWSLCCYLAFLFVGKRNENTASKQETSTRTWQAAAADLRFCDKRRKSKWSMSRARCSVCVCVWSRSGVCVVWVLHLHSYVCVCTRAMMVPCDCRCFVHEKLLEKVLYDVTLFSKN